MNELRWILIGFGIVLLAGIYLWGRRGRAEVDEDTALRSRPEPALQPRSFGEVRRELQAAVDDIPTYQVDAPDDEVQLGQAEGYEATAIRQVNPRSEPRAPRGEVPRAFTKEPPAAAPHESPLSKTLPDFRRGRVEPTLGSDEEIDEPYAAPSAPVSAPVSASVATAPTLSSSESPPPRRHDNRRKILSLRLSAAPNRIEGAKLQEVLTAEALAHGKYDVFHRLHSDGQSIFSIASMVEPGTFDLEKMNETLYPGVTMFAQLPGPVPGMHALNEMVACARRLHDTLGGVLQDDRGVPLTVHRIERMRQEVREFERPPSNTGRTARGEGYQE